MEVTSDLFESQRQRRFGTQNPERMPLRFWEWMIRNSEDARTRDVGPPRETRPQLGHTPTDLRRYFGQEGDYSAGPIWNFDRMGATRTPHPDGRMICIGGEHEDHYDPDFCIYNDVVVLDLDGSIAIYGYPNDLFPPTDFHTATLSRRSRDPHRGARVSGGAPSGHDARLRPRPGELPHRTSPLPRGAARLDLRP